MKRNQKRYFRIAVLIFFISILLLNSIYIYFDRNANILKQKTAIWKRNRCFHGMRYIQGDMENNMNPI